MNRLLQRVEGDESQRGPQGRFGCARRALVSEKLRQRFERQLAKSLALREQPLLERCLVEAKPLQQLTAIEVGRTLESGRRALSDEAGQLHDIDVHGVCVQSNGIALDE